MVIVSPALAEANNGNWRTAHRWLGLLQDRHAVRIIAQWPDADARGDRVMLALHARRSAPAVQAWCEERGPASLGLVLTGTDLYPDLQRDRAAMQSAEQARRLVLLQAQGPAALPPHLRDKARVIYQSATASRPVPKPRRRLRAVMVGHLRDVKSPQTLFEAARLLGPREDIRIDHIGDADEAWAAQARATEADCPSYRWLGPVHHATARRAIAKAHVLVHTSRVEGGAHVVMEAICSGTPVLASRIPGNVGLLGDDYDGYFAHGDAAALAQLLATCRAQQSRPADDPAAALLIRLRAQCDRRAPLFHPEAERAALLQLVQDLQDPP